MQMTSCPSCAQSIQNDGTLSGHVVACPNCGNHFQMPGVAVPPIPVHSNAQVGGPPTINVFMSQQVTATAAYDWNHQGSLGGLSVPLLISAISNILVGLFWLATLFGVVLAIPMFILSVFELILYSRVGHEPVARSASSARIVAIFELIVGIFNLPTMICGIILLVNSSSAVSRSRLQATRNLPQQMPNFVQVHSAPPAVNLQRRVPPPPRIRP